MRLALRPPRLRGPSGRTALFLYVVLVVLPAVVFGGLLWRQLQREQERVLLELPQECEDAARRLAEQCFRRVNIELQREFLRPFEAYRSEAYVDDLGPIRTEASPLSSEPRQDSVLGWFSFVAPDPAQDRFGEPVALEVLRGAGDPATLDPTASLIEEIVRAEFLEGPEPAESLATAELESVGFEGWGQTRSRRLRAVLLNVAEAGVEECRSALDANQQLYEGEQHDVHVSYFSFRTARLEPSGRPLLIAYRRVVLPKLTIPLVETCFEPITRDLMHIQGVAFDPDWLFSQLPKEEAAQVLGPSLRFIQPGTRLAKNPDPDVYFALDNLLPFFNMEQDVAPDIMSKGTMFVSSDVGERRRGFRVQNSWFGAVALVLMISMSIGIQLLLSSIRRSREETERTRNFVASVTHELRTPIAAVKLYGEMLKDGWFQDDARRVDYLTRIVAESDRLDQLVDRVLLRRRLSDQHHEPSAGSLNTEVSSVRPGLELVGGTKAEDLRFELEEGLPLVQLLPEGIHVILTNLVENARKYASPPAASADLAEPAILVRTRLDQRSRAVLEVLDRGPGIAEEDRGRIFEAFRRLGDEATRKTKGTGLGLHLVALQAKAMGAKVSVHPRDGGGSIFRVTLGRA
ncbi:MAG: HAMP domain-containing sensor histidine kinase [Planctomycetota bacterium]|nr:HAMP domain-containing sensor histidine kinase [Planctomycetota bacterium]MDG1984590.1 HAMP domain-containing sensor histidine kinase [Planctomycetota bacterium]